MPTATHPPPRLRPLAGVLGRACLLAAGCGWLAGGAAASDTLAFSLGDIQAAGWRAENVRVSLDLRSSEARLRIDRLWLPAPMGKLRSVAIVCARARLSGPVFSCEGGRARLRHPALAAREFDLELRLRRSDGELHFRVHGLPLAGGTLDLDGRGTGGHWRLHGRARALDLTRLAALPGPQPAQWSAAGHAAAEFDLALQAGRIGGALTIALRDAQLSGADGRLATEALDLDLRLDLRPDPRGLLVRADARSPRGQLYVEPVFVDAGRHPFELTAQGHWDGELLDLAEFRLDQPGVVAALGHLAYSREDGLRDAGVLIESATLASFYPLYLQPFLIGTPLDDLNAGGRVAGELAFAHGAPARVDLRLSEVDLEDRRGRYSMRGLTGHIDWWPRPPADGVRDSELSWREGSVRGIPLGPGELPLRLVGRDLALLAPSRVPVLDGALIVNTLTARSLGLPAMELAFDARLAPIALARLSEALGWPVFSGTLAGRLPSLSYQAGELSLGGQLLIEAFGGRITVDRLRLREPFGAVPRLAADIALRGLDLEAITDTFSFGRIEGRLDGDIRQLRLLNWQPAAFEARFYTPDNDRSRHRISQRAIENISNIGGGAAGAILSRGFLSLFQSFAYDRIGISCRLQEDVCVMGGLAPGPEGRGYYLVRGRLLPRVDIIGFQRQVSWPTLVEQIKSVTRSEEVIVE